MTSGREKPDVYWADIDWRILTGRILTGRTFTGRTFTGRCLQRIWIKLHFGWIAEHSTQAAPLAW